MILNEGVAVSDGLGYMVKRGLPLNENIYRPYSDEYFNVINETRELYKNGSITLCEDDEWLINTNVGETAIFEGDTVWLDIPFEMEEEEEEFIVEAEYRGRKVKLSSPFRYSVRQTVMHSFEEKTGCPAAITFLIYPKHD